jgi:hypothetical protein
MIQQEPREKETCKLGTVEGKTRKGLPIPAGRLGSWGTWN